MARGRFAKYQALGNDYLVMDSREVRVDPETARRLCHRHSGAGADGILVRDPAEPDEPFRLRIFNPDGSEAEKSGNGLRIFARYLFDRGDVGSGEFRVTTPGGTVTCLVSGGGRVIRVDMGRVSFHSLDIPVTGPEREVLCESIDVDGETLEFSAATIGNPHCVILRDPLAEDDVRRFGPLIEVDPRFPNRTNVQFARPIDRANLELEIWERGAGRTLASASSASAAAAVARRLGICDASLTVRMPGGDLAVEIAPDYAVRITGPAEKVYEADIPDEYRRS